MSAAKIKINNKAVTFHCTQDVSCENVFPTLEKRAAYFFYIPRACGDQIMQRARQAPGSRAESHSHDSIIRRAQRRKIRSRSTGARNGQ